MKDLFDILSAYHKQLQNQEQQPLLPYPQKLVVIDMDNVPHNGTKIQEYMLAHAASLDSATEDDDDERMTLFLNTRVIFCNTMVDRITSSRPDSHGMVPRCEPLPLKALVIGDYTGYVHRHVFPPLIVSQQQQQHQPGIFLRQTPQQLQRDIDLKLSIANGTHTAIAHTLALLGHTMTTVLSYTNESEDHDQPTSKNIFMEYLDALVHEQIIPSCSTTDTPANLSNDAHAVWLDWKQRLIHPHFGLSTFFITQNGTAKGGIRWGPTVMALLQHDSDMDENTDAPSINESFAVQKPPIQVSFALAYAVLLRWLTPTTTFGEREGVYRGWLNGFDPQTTTNASTDATCSGTEYADGLCYELQQGWYDFKCPLPDLISKLHACLKSSKAQPQDCRDAVRYYLTQDQGGNLTDIGPAASAATNRHFEELVDATAVLYARLIAGDDLLDILKELQRSAYGIGFTSPCRALLLAATTPATLVSPPASAAARLLHYRPQSIPDSSRLLDLPVTLSNINDVVTSEVQSVVAIDLHTHLLPPSHGPLCLWGIDELLTYVRNSVCILA